MSNSEDPVPDVSHRDIFGDSESESEDEFEGFDQPITQDAEEEKEVTVEAIEKEKDVEEDKNEEEAEIKPLDSEEKEEKEGKEDIEEKEDDIDNDKQEPTVDEENNERRIVDSDDEESIFKERKSKQLDVSSDSEPELDDVQKVFHEDSDDEEQQDSTHVAGPSASREKADSEIESEDEDRPGNNSGMVYDFDIMLQKKKSQMRRRKKKNVDIINDNDDIVAALLSDMKKAAEEDFIANQKGMPSMNKLKMLDVVASNLMKIDFREALLDCGVLRAIASWLSRLPDGSLPSLKIRTTMLNILTYLNTDDIDMIKSSGLGKVVMYVFKNPKETKENKIMANKLITNWSKLIFNIETEGGANLRDERERRDHEMFQTKRRTSGVDIPNPKRLKEETQAQLRPGEKGWVSRARVPAPSMKDYVVRPKSKIDVDLTKMSAKKEISRFEKHIRTFKEKKKVSKTGRMFTVSIEGRKM